jgi:formate dehydrogenase
MEDGSYESISWNQALREIGDKIKKLRKVDGPDAIGMYVGTAAGFGVLHPVFAQGFMTGIGSKSMYASATQDCSNKFSVSRHMYGFPFTLPYPDIENTNCLIIVGANPVISKWSFLQVNNPSLKLKELEKRGGKLYIIDPRKTETANVGGQHVFIRPGTDVFFYLSFLDELINKKGHDEENVEKYMTGFGDVINLAKKWPAEKTSQITSIDPLILGKMVNDYITSDGAALYCSTGVNMGGQGTLAFWIQEVINAVSGNLDKKGGTIVGNGIMDFPKFGAKNGLLMRDDKSRIGNFGSVNDAFPGGILADEILTEGDKQIKALIVTGGNPLLTMPNSERLKTAFEKLDLLITLDIYQNETGSVADYVLPSTDPFQRPDLPFIFPLMLGLQLKPYLQATKAIVSPKDDQRDEASIYLDLCKASGVNLFGSKVAQKFFEIIQKYNTRKNKLRHKTLPQESMLNFLLRVNKQRSFKSILKEPHGLIRNSNKADNFLGKRVYTKNKLIDLAPSHFMDQSENLNVVFDKELKNINRFKLISKRAVKTNNSWTHNTQRMIAKGQDTNFVYMNPDDVSEMGFAEDQLVDVKSTTSYIRLKVKPLDTLMRKTVAIPHGWGHQDALGMKIASSTKGVNVNILVADGPNNVDKLSGMSKLTAIDVEISSANTPQKNNWSGR